MTEEQKEQKCLKCEEYLNGWKRARADYLNLQKEAAERQKELVEFANAGLLLDLLPMVDHFKLALKHVPENIKNDPWYKGIENIQGQLNKFLKDQGIEEIKTVGEKFNPELHEAVGEVEGEPAEVIAEEVSTGFSLNGKVIQPAKVKIFKKGGEKNNGNH